jgi:general stress protein 26
MPKNDGSDTARTLRKLLKGFRAAMLTTVAPGGALRSRPMVTVREQQDGDVWFLTKAETSKVGEVQENQRVNVGYASPEDGRYVSLSGLASVVKDPQRVQDLWRKRHRKWFPEGKRDPELVALRVRVERAEYWDDASGQMVALEPSAASAPVAAPPNDDAGAVARAADAMKALVTGSENHAEEKPPTPGGAQG